MERLLRASEWHTAKRKDTCGAWFNRTKDYFVAFKPNHRNKNLHLKNVENLKIPKKLGMLLPYCAITKI